MHFYIFFMHSRPRKYVKSLLRNDPFYFQVFRDKTTTTSTTSMNSDRGLTNIRAVPGLYSRAYSHGVEYIPGVLEYIPGV